MAKTKNITERPMIIVSLAVSKWGVEYLKEKAQNGNWTKTGQLVTVNPNEASVDECTDHKIVKIKDETAKTGSFLIKCGPWSCNIVLPDGTLSTFWECGNNTEYLYSSLNECLSVLKLHPAIVDGRPVIIERRAESYFNTETKEVTKDRKIAESWFKGQNPLFIRSSQYQQIGIWVNGGTNYVDVQYYYSNRLQREKCDSWKKAKIAGFRLYNDGTISHFYKGKLYDRDREFCTTRMNYRTLDVRFQESYRLSTLCLDLRSKELDNSTKKLCPETLKILKKAGFPETYWCWGNSKRHFEDTYDLVNFATHIQNKNSTKRGATIAEFLSDKPFNQTCEKVLEFNKGVIIRIPGYLETWKCDGKTFNHCPRPYEVQRKATAILLEAKVYERYRIWISNDGKTRSCQENIHDGTLWSQCRWDNLRWPDNLKEKYDFTAAETEEERKIQEAAVTQYNEMVKTTYSKIFQIMPIFARMSDFLERHPDLNNATGIRALLDAIYYAPKLTETLIKIGHEDWFYKNVRGHVYGAAVATRDFSIYNVLDRFGIRSTSEYKEKAGVSMYKNLGVTKEQFLWLSTYAFGPEFMYLFRNIEIRIPGKTTNYAQFSDIPMKTLLAIAKATENLNKQMRYDFSGTSSEHYYSAATRIQRLMSAYDLTPVDIEKCVNRQLDLMMLEDYLRLRQRCDGHDNFNIASWDKIPANQTDLRFSHDRLTEFYNLILANAERYYRQEEEKRLIVCQEKYDVRYKKLKKLAYTKGDEERVIVVPKKLIELVVEGQTLHHCVGSFTQSVSEGRDTIVFLRHKDTPTVPYATVALLQRGDKWVVDQAHTAHNGPITSQDVAFLKRWGEQNNVDINSITERYGAKCHH